MYAPIFPYYAMPNKLWHKVNPLDLVHPICNPRGVLMCTQICDELPTDADYCQTCAIREHFFAAVRA